MRHAGNFPSPNKGERSMILRKCKAMVKKWGSARQAALRIGIDQKYLTSMIRGERYNPGDDTLKKLGLRRVCYIEER